LRLLDGHSLPPAYRRPFRTPTYDRLASSQWRKLRGSAGMTSGGGGGGFRFSRAATAAAKYKNKKIKDKYIEERLDSALWIFHRPLLGYSLGFRSIWENIGEWTLGIGTGKCRPFLKYFYLLMLSEEENIYVNYCFLSCFEIILI